MVPRLVRIPRVLPSRPPQEARCREVQHQTLNALGSVLSSDRSPSSMEETPDVRRSMAVVVWGCEEVPMTDLTPLIAEQEKG